MKHLVGCLVVLLGACAARAEESLQAIVDKVNANNAKVKSLVADVENVTRRRSFAFTATGRLYYEKEKNFRMVTTSATSGDPAADIGSNDSYFWFYIKKMDSKQAFYALYRDLYRTGLQDSLNPATMMESLGLAEVHTTGARVYNSGGVLVVLVRSKSPSGEGCLRATLIDPFKKAVIGQRIYDEQQRLHAAVQIQESYVTNVGVYIPKKIVMTWHDENITGTQTLSNPQINVRIPAETWRMPRFGVPVTDMGKQRVNFERYRE